MSWIAAMASRAAATAARFASARITTEVGIDAFAAQNSLGFALQIHIGTFEHTFSTSRTDGKS
jgi:hypothetical protein